MTATLKTGIVQEPSSSIANLTLSSSGGVTFGAAATTNTITSAAATALTIQSAGTTAMTIDTSQNVGIGTTSPSSKLEVVGNIKINGYSIVGGSTASSVNLYSGTAFNTGGASIAIRGTANGYNNGGIDFYTGSGATGSQNMTIDSSGNVGIGTTSPQSYSGFTTLDIAGSTGGLVQVKNSGATIKGTFYVDGNGARVGTQTANGLLFDIGGSEKARIDSSGNLLVGTTDSGGTTGYGVKIRPAGQGANNPDINFVVASNLAGITPILLYSTGATAYRFYVDAAGVIHATSTSITAISDQTLKTNIKTLETGLAEVMRLQPRRFDWINGDGENKAGFVAQEVQEVLPDLVAPFKYNDDETKLGLKMGDMIPTLVKAIQELSAKVDAQAAEITALQAKVGA